MASDALSQILEKEKEGRRKDTRTNLRQAPTKATGVKGQNPRKSRIDRDQQRR